MLRDPNTTARVFNASSGLHDSLTNDFAGKSDTAAALRDAIADIDANCSTYCEEFLWRKR